MTFVVVIMCVPHFAPLPPPDFVVLAPADPRGGTVHPAASDVRADPGLGASASLCGG